MGKTSIQWTDFSVNPVRARLKNMVGVSARGTGHYCEKVSAGCTHCYSSCSQVRWGLPPFEAPHKDKVEIFFDPKMLKTVLSRRIPTKWFWCDMTDIFGSWVPDEWLDQMFAVMALTPQHTHQVLTKRADRLAAYLGDFERPHRVRDAIYKWHEAQGPDYRSSNSLPVHPLKIGQDLSDRLTHPQWPLPNVWVGVSVENQLCADERIPLLLQTPAAVRFLSLEPLLGEINLLNLGLRGALHWAIIGGESGNKARPPQLRWLRSLVQQLHALWVATFVKQTGRSYYDDSDSHRRIFPADKKGGDWKEWPPDLRVREFPAAWLAATGRA